MITVVKPLGPSNCLLLRLAEPQIPSRSDSPTPFLAPDEAVINKNMMLQLMSYTLRSVPQNSTPEQLEEMVAVSFRASDSFRPRLKPCHRASCRVYERQESTITRLLHDQKVLFERIYCIFSL